jgi:hypothetical protein
MLYVKFVILLYRALFNSCNYCFLRKCIVNHMLLRKYGSSFVNLILWCALQEKYMSYMFYRKILMSSSSAFIGWFLLFLLERKISIKHTYDNFRIVFVYCVDHGKNTKSVVWYFSWYKVFSCSFIPPSLSFLCRQFYLSNYHENFMVG